MSRVFYIKDRADLDAKKKFIWSALVEMSVKPFCINITDVIRGIQQNRKIWPLFKDLADQKEFNGALITNEDWKHILVSGWAFVEKGVSPRIFMGLENEVVTFNKYSTSKMGKRDFSSLIEYVYAYGTTEGVVWSEKACASYDEYKELS